MGSLSPLNRALLYLFSMRNIAGCLFALAGLALFFTGVIGRGWWAITAGLYAAGALMFADDAAASLRARSAMLTGNLVEQLDRLIAEVRKRIPPESLARLESIRVKASSSSSRPCSRTPSSPGSSIASPGWAGSSA